MSIHLTLGDTRLHTLEQLFREGGGQVTLDHQYRP